MPSRHRLPPAVLFGVLAAVAIALAHTAEIRARADAALGRGVPPREAALARGFVLGEDDEVDAATSEDFRRAGLSHLLAVSGQNVALLALLAMPILAALGMPLRTRLVWVLGLIAVYVPLAGAGPSIQRAGVMGGLSLIAALSGRRSSRLYALALAALVTLAIEPGVAGDVSWQLSFAAVLGILFLAAPLRRAIAAGTGARAGLGGALAEGAALTIAATLATAPLIAFRFGEVSTVTLFANLLAMPAVAPAMWMGMLSAAAGQIPGFPVEPFNLLGSLMLAYIAQIASWCATPSWAYLRVSIDGAALVATYAAIVAAAVLAMRLSRRRRLAAKRVAGGRRSRRPPGPGKGRAAARKRRPLVALGAALALLVLLLVPGGDVGADPARGAGLRISVLDVGQGDSILLQPPGAPAVLVDGGPPGDELASKLRDAGVEGLGAAVITHDQADHAGGIVELLGSVPIGRLVYAVLDRRKLATARAAGALPQRVWKGGELRSGGLRLEVLWPPRELLAGPHTGEDPNLLAIVLLARWRGFTMLLTADAEAETTPMDPGPLDVLKVSHHGSEDAGLAALLERTLPKLAVISVGAGNSYGLPAPSTLATLAAHGVPTLRTDRDGTIAITVGRSGFSVDTG